MVQKCYCFKPVWFPLLIISISVTAEKQHCVFCIASQFCRICYWQTNKKRQWHFTKNASSSIVFLLL